MSIGVIFYQINFIKQAYQIIDPRTMRTPQIRYPGLRISTTMADPNPAMNTTANGINLLFIMLTHRFERVGFDSAVTIRLAGGAIVGNGQNVSEQGVFFLSEGSIPVTVEIDGREGSLPGELVRIENMGAGMVGIAVKFDDTHSDLVDG